MTDTEKFFEDAAKFARGEEHLKANGCMTHVVFKVSDAEKYLDPTALVQLRNLLNQISLGREADGKDPAPTYFVCNRDEPYADQVEEAILSGEKEKQEERV